jgi:hypothetical protein
VSAAVWGISLALAFTCGIAFAIAWRRAGRQLHAILQPDPGHRDDPPLSHAWPPGSPPLPLIERLPPRVARDDCGCLFGDGWWSPCRIHDTGVLATFIDTNADAWAARLAEGDQ